MAMYVSLLTRCLADAEAAPPTTPQAIEDFVRSAQQLSARRTTGGSDLATLASELGYDRALINACAAVGIPVGPEDFTDPWRQRRRVEGMLAEAAPFWRVLVDDAGPGAG